MPVGRAAPDAQSLLQGLLSRLNAKPEYLAGFNPDYVNNVNTLYQNLAGQETGLDTQETQARTGYERNLGDLAAQQAKAVEALRNRLATRGTLNSSILNDETANINNQFETQRSDLGSARDAALAQLAGQRLGFEGGYDQNLMGLNNALTGQATDYIGGKAQAEKDAILAQQQADAATKLSNQTATTTNQQIPAMTPPPLDLSAIIKALSPAPPPVAKPVAPPPAIPQLRMPVAAPPKPSIYDPGRVALTSSPGTTTGTKPKAPIIPKSLQPIYGRY